MTEKDTLNGKSFRAAVITVSDKGYAGLREDMGGPLVAGILKDAGYDIPITAIIPDEQNRIEKKLIECADSCIVDLIVTTGGTGFSIRDVTPEATVAVCQRLAPGIPEAMRFESLKKTPRAMLSRAAAGIRGRTLIINLPGSPKAAQENLNAVLPSLRHGLEMLTGGPADCAARFSDQEVPMAIVTSVNISEKKGVRKKAVGSVTLRVDHGIVGDAHAGNWHRQISLLADESIDKVRSVIPNLTPGIFAENINTKGLVLYELPVGTKLKIGPALVEVSQIGKQCHGDGCEIKRLVGDCIMPREGIFVVVLEGGVVKAGDEITVLSD